MHEGMFSKKKKKYLITYIKITRDINLILPGPPHTFPCLLNVDVESDVKYAW